MLIVENNSLSTNTQKLNAVANNAVQDYQANFVKIKKITKCDAEPVYNMEVETHHNFSVQGGLIVHNCIDAVRYAMFPVWRLRGN